MRGRTTFADRAPAATIRKRHAILVFDVGHVIESVNFDEIVAQGGRFAELHAPQFMVQENSRRSARFNRGWRLTLSR